MYSCPTCGAEQVAERIRCQCGTDLTLLRTLDAVADAWFNQALKVMDDGNLGRALEWLSACCAARPTDAVARRAQAKVWAQLGCWKEASDAVERALDLEPDALEAREIQQAVREKDVPPAMAGPRKMEPKRKKRQPRKGRRH